MRIENCYFCSGKIYPGHGVNFVRNDCKVFKFCRPKCHSSFKKKKNPRNTRWTKTYRKSSGRELAIDPSFEFEKRRNIPVKYNRELWKNAVNAIQKISNIRSKREGNYVHRRLQVGAYKDIMELKSLTEKHMHLVRLPAADIKKSEVKTEEEEIKLNDEVQDTIVASTSKISEKKKKAKELKRNSDDSKMLEEYSDVDSDQEDEYNDDDDSDEDSNMSGMEVEEVMLDCA